MSELDTCSSHNQRLTMNDNRIGGIALILGALSGIVTLTFHPSGGQHHVTLAQLETLIAVVVGVHALAIAGLPISFAGGLALTRRIDSPLRLALLGLIVYGFGLIAMMGAATMSGLVTPPVLRQMVAPGSGGEWHTFMNYTHMLNQAFARIGALATSVAIFLWSLLLIRRSPLARILGAYGLLSAACVIVTVIAGRLGLELHGFRIVTLLQAMWFIGAGVLLWRDNVGGYASTSSSAVQSSGSSASDLAATFSSRRGIEAVPGIGSLNG